MANHSESQNLSRPPPPGGEPVFSTLVVLLTTLPPVARVPTRTKVLAPPLRTPPPGASSPIVALSRHPPTVLLGGPVGKNLLSSLPSGRSRTRRMRRAWLEMLSDKPATPFAKRRNTSACLRTKRVKSELVFDYNCCKRVSYQPSASSSARRAKLKQKEARAVGKSIKNLGRYGH